jgi:hypothetical protein
MSPASYKEFVLPYNSRILQTFGGGCLHYCGNATHQAQNFLRMEGLLAINNYSLYGLKAFKELKAQLEGRIVLFACDFTPLEHEAYFRELLDGLSFHGLVIDSQYTSHAALIPGGKYVQACRDVVAGRRQVFEYLRGCLHQGTRSSVDAA